MKIIEPKVELWQQGDDSKAEVTLLCKYVKNKHIGNCPDCVFNKYLCYGLLCNIVVLKVIKDEEK